MLIFIIEQDEYQKFFLVLNQDGLNQSIYGKRKLMKITHYIKKKLISFKQTKLWYFFLRFFFIPIFDFIWVNIINFQGRLLAIIFLFKKRDFYKIEKYEDAKLIKDEPEFQKIAYKIKNFINNNLIDELKNKLELEAKKKLDPTENKFNSFRISLFEFLPDEIKEEIVKFALSEKNLVTATKHLKVLPIIKKVSVYLNIPKEKSEKGSQLWHKDDFGYKSLDIFLAVSDINLNNGPLYYVKTKNKLGVFFKIKEVIKKAVPGERNKVLLDVFSNHFKENEIGTLIGKSGTGIFVDSFTKYHRGGFCKSENRVMLRISYQTPDSSRGNESYHPEKFFYYPKIYKKDVKNIFHKYVIFKTRNNFLKFIKIDNIILFFIKIFHYKN